MWLERNQLPESHKLCLERVTMTMFKEKKDMVRFVLYHSDGKSRRQTGEENVESGDQSGNYYDDPRKKYQRSQGCLAWQGSVEHLCQCSLCKWHPLGQGNMEAQTPKSHFVVRMERGARFERYSFSFIRSFIQMGAEYLLCVRHYFGAWDTMVIRTETVSLYLALGAAGVSDSSDCP